MSELFSVATFNVNSIRARLPLVLDWLRERSPDVLCLQETKVQDVDFPQTAFEEAGYAVAFSGQKSYNGVAIASKHPIEDARSGFDDPPHDEARLICATVRNVPIVNTYAPNGESPTSEKFRYKLDWFARLQKFFEQRYTPDAPLLWVGDINIAPDSRRVRR